MAGTGQPDPLLGTKNKLKKEGDNLHQFGASLSNASRSTSDFNAWIEQFENGYVEKTPEPQDTPYGKPFSSRPRITIL